MRKLLIPILALLLATPVWGQTQHDRINAKGINNVRKCDQFAGANAGAKIAACIADLPSTGGVADARGLEGAQTIPDALTITADNVTLLLGAASITSDQIQLQGANDFKFLCYGTVITLEDALDQSLLAIVDSQRVWVEGCVLDGNDANNTTGHTLRIRSGATDGQQSKDVTVIGNTFRNGAFTNLITDGDSNDLVEKVRVIGNTFSTSAQDNAAFEIATRDSVFIGNVCEGGIDCLSLDDNTDTVRPTNITVSGNSCRGATNACFDISRSNDVSVTGNTCEGTSASTACFRYRDSTNIASAGNVSKNSAGDGFRIDSPNTAVNTRITLSGDIAENSTSENFFVSDSQVVILDGVVSHTAGSNGVQITTSNNVTISDSYSEEAGLNGFEADATSDLRIVGNTSKNNGNSGSCSNDCNGFKVNTGGSANQDSIFIVGNRAWDDQGTQTQKYGLEIRGTSFDFTNLIVFGNDFSTNLTGTVNNPNSETLTSLPSFGGLSLIGELTVGAGGVSADGGGLKHSRTTSGCATAASVGATCDTTVTWSTAFANANYTVVCVGYGVASGVPVHGGTHSRLAASIQFRTVAMTAAAAQYTNIVCIAAHD